MLSYPSARPDPRVAADKQQRTIGRLPADGIPSEELLHKTVALPAGFQHLGGSRVRISGRYGAGLLELAVQRERFLGEHLVRLKRRIDSLDFIGQDNQLAWRISFGSLLVEILRIGNTRNCNAAQIIRIADIAFQLRDWDSPPTSSCLN